VVDPNTGEVVPDGEDGELVFTSLTKEALPIIRYRTRDLTRLLPASARTMRRMGKITGRSDDMLIIRGVNVFPTQIEEQVLKMPKLAPQFQIHVERHGNMDAVTVNVEMRPEVAQTASEADVETLGNQLQHNIKSLVGISSHINVLEPDSIERSLGKAKRVVDHRPKA
jgi:phenylacetate-CoA ligase